tara:strand:+ start:2699 stop:2857 length:159 start_codon:yes stop_codon:yes gene_type:complete
MNYFKKLITCMGIIKRNRVLWLEVPMDCDSRERKDLIILSTIDTLEQQIKIN